MNKEYQISSDEALLYKERPLVSSLPPFDFLVYLMKYVSSRLFPFCHSVTKLPK